jgi:hypothetical protein
VKAARHRAWRPAKNVLLLLLLAGLAYFYTHDYSKRAKGTDFPDFYTAARMVSEGFGHQLYDAPAQEKFQLRYVGRTGTYYIRPPFETLIFLPVSLWSLETAFRLWCLLNVGFLACTALVFQKDILDGVNWRVWLPVFLLFPPVLINFQQGQDSLFLLLIMTLAVVALTQGKDFKAGCLLGCGLFKFHIILALVVLVVLQRRRRRFLGGFALVFVTLVLISAGISGWSFLIAYPRFLVSLSSSPLSGIHPSAMANLRGLISVSGIAPDATARFVLTCSASTLLLVWAAWNGRSKFADTASLVFGNFVLAAILVSYHLSPSDLSLALLPMALLWASLTTNAGTPRSARLALLGLECLLFLPPMHLFLLTWHVYAYASVPFLILFVMSARSVRMNMEATKA